MCKTKDLKILSLFDGMACGMLAMQKSGAAVSKYYAYEIDKYAIQTATHNFPMIKECGDVFEADFTQYKDIDYLIGGSPCTYWSIAQKNNRETEASGLGWELFSQYVRALNEVKPKFFIYENNKSMSKAIRQSITETFGFEPVCINSALVSAQNRQRLYWVGKKNPDGTYSKVEVEQPVDKGILIKDILDTGCDLTSNDKSWTLTASYDGAVAWNTIERCQRNMVAEPVACRCRGRKDKDGNGYAKYECREDGESNTLDTNSTNGSMIAEPVNTTANGKSQCLRATYYKDGIRNIVGNNIDKKTGIAEPVRVGALPRPNGELSTSQAMRVYSTEGKSVNLTAGGGGMGGKTGLYAIPIYEPIEESISKIIDNMVNYIGYANPCEWDEKNNPTKAISYADGKTYTVYEVKNGLITIKQKQYPIKLNDGYYIIRKLTVSECKRLQTVPEWYEFPVSNSQAYKMLGNGWTVDVIAHLIKSTYE